MAGDPFFDIDGNGGTTTSAVVTVTGTDTPYTGVGVSSLQLVVNGVVRPNPLSDARGIWSGIVGLVPGPNTVAAVETVDGVQRATRTVVYDYTFGAPTSPGAASTTSAAMPTQAVAISTPGGLTNRPSLPLSGTATPGVGVTVRDNGSVVSSYTANTDGFWGGIVPLAAGKNEISASVKDAFGNLVQSNAIVESVDASPPSVAISAEPQAVVGSTAVLSGTVSDDTGVARVDVYEGGSALGSATLDGRGGWTFQHDFGAGRHGSLHAEAIDTAGNVADASAPYTLVTGITGRPYASAVEQAGADGSVTAITTLRPDGSAGSRTAPGPDGREVATGIENGQWVVGLGGDVMTGNGIRETFAFGANMGHAEVTDFIVGGRGHDVIGLSAADGFGSVAEILAQTTMRHGAAVIVITPDDTIRLDGVTKAQLAHHPEVFRTIA